MLFSLFFTFLIVPTVLLLSDIIYTWASWNADRQLVGIIRYSYITLQDLDELLLLPDLESTCNGLESKKYGVLFARGAEEPLVRFSNLSSSLNVEYIPQGTNDRVSLFFKKFSEVYLAKYLVKLRKLQLKNQVAEGRFIPFDQLRKK